MHGLVKVINSGRHKHRVSDAATLRAFLQHSAFFDDPNLEQFQLEEAQGALDAALTAPRSNRLRNL